jgi:hypothetical protein
MTDTISNQPSEKSLSKSLKLQESAQKLIVAGIEHAGPDNPAGAAIVKWQLARRKFAAREIKTAGDALLAAFFAKQALETIPLMVTSASGEAVIFLADEAHRALCSILKFSEQVTGKSPADLGLFENYFPKILH